MKIFIVGLPSSGRTTVSKSLSKDLGLVYIDPTFWIKSTFRDRNPEEHEQQYSDSYNEYLINRLQLDPDLCARNVKDIIKTYPEISDSKNNRFIIDGLLSPRDFMQLFNYNEDIVVFLNRTDNEAEYKDNQNIGVSVTRDYCFWMASLKLLPKERWIEFNFSIPGNPENNSVKKLGIHNTVLLVKSIDKVISSLKENLMCS